MPKIRVVHSGIELGSSQKKMRGSDPRDAFHKAPLAKDVESLRVIRSVCSKLMGFEDEKLS